MDRLPRPRLPQDARRRRRLRAARAQPNTIVGVAEVCPAPRGLPRRLRPGHRSKRPLLKAERPPPLPPLLDLNYRPRHDQHRVAVRITQVTLRAYVYAWDGRSDRDGEGTHQSGASWTSAAPAQRRLAAPPSADGAARQPSLDVLAAVRRLTCRFQHSPHRTRFAQGRVHATLSGGRGGAAARSITRRKSIARVVGAPAV